MITKIEASILWGNGFKLKDKEGRVYGIHSVYDTEMYLYAGNIDFDKYVKFSKIGTDYFIICHSLDKLTQAIMHEGKEVFPIQQLYSISFPNGVNGCRDKINAKGFLKRNFYHFHFGKKGFAVKMKDRNETKFIAPNQPALFAYMDSLHFDRFGWSDRGLTVDKGK